VTLGTERLQSLLMVVLHRADTDSLWPLTNVTTAKYNQRERADCNLQLPLWQVIRGSTAAPFYFPPEEVPLATGGGQGLPRCSKMAASRRSTSVTPRCAGSPGVGLCCGRHVRCWDRRSTRRVCEDAGDGGPDRRRGATTQPCSRTVDAVDWPVAHDRDAPAS
jgi:hypothetical protein